MVLFGSLALLPGLTFWLLRVPLHWISNEWVFHLHTLSVCIELGWCAWRLGAPNCPNVWVPVCGLLGLGGLRGIVFSTLRCYRVAIIVGNGGE